MSEVQNYKCDVCGKVAAGEDYDNPLGWYRVSVQTKKDSKDFWKHNKDVCYECAEKSGLVEALRKMQP